MFTTTRTACVSLAAAVLAIGVTTAATAPGSANAQPAALSVTKVAAAAPAAAPCGPAVSSQACVASFYGAYIAALDGPTTGEKELPALRKQYLSPQAIRDLAAWQKAHQADAVLHAQGAPGGYDTIPLGGGRIRVSLHWFEHDTQLDVTVDVETRMITRIVER